MISSLLWKEKFLPSTLKYHPKRTGNQTAIQLPSVSCAAWRRILNILRPWRTLPDEHSWTAVQDKSQKQSSPHRKIIFLNLMCKQQQQDSGALMATLNTETVLLSIHISRCFSTGTHNACSADRIARGWALLTVAWGFEMEKIRFKPRFNAFSPSFPPQFYFQSQRKQNFHTSIYL